MSLTTIDGRPPKRRRRRWDGIAVVVIALLALLAIVRFLSSQRISEHENRDKTIRVALPPPPPPPPKPEPPKPITPPKEIVPQPSQVQPPPTPQAATPPSDALTAREGQGGFGLGVGNGSGRIGGGGGGFGWYAGVIQTDIERALQLNPKITAGRFNLLLKLQVGTTGQIDQVSLASSTGDTALDALIIQTLQHAAISQPPPEGLPQPITLRIGASAHF